MNCSDNSPQRWRTPAAWAAALGVHRNTMDKLLADCPPELSRKRRTPAGRGRPAVLYHYSAHPRTFAAFEAERTGRAPAPQGSAAPGRPPAAHDLSLAQLRAQAVREYRARCYHLTKAQAAAATCADWSRPRVRRLSTTEALGRHHRRAPDRPGLVSLGGFSEPTLRRWDKAFQERGLAGLIPCRRGVAGRARKEIPARLLDLVAYYSTRGARADVRKAIGKARASWPGEWPDVSDRTILNRIRERDPHQRFSTLGRAGIAAYNNAHMPDVMRDYSQHSYNQLWQLDDFTADWYAHASEAERIMRPFAYGIIRASTRQWIFAVTSETPITQAQVRSLVGLALATASCGIPEDIQFERGAVACDDELEELLATLEINVHRTSMDSGAIHAAALPDKPSGHWAGKALIERNIRTHHGHHWEQPGQIGCNERTSAPARVRTLKDLAIKAQAEGRPLLLPKPGDFHKHIYAALERHNQTPHRGLPETVDPQTGERRNLTPNEYAQVLRDEEIRVMDPSLLPLFFDKAIRRPVTRNGVKLNNNWYGWADQDLLDLKSATLYELPEHPEAAYCEELGRLIVRYDKATPRQAALQLEKSRAAGAKYRNRYRALIDRLRAADQTLIDSSRAMADPVPERSTRIIAPASLKSRLTRIAEAIERRGVQESGQPTPAVAAAPRSGLLTRSRDLEAQLDALGLCEDGETSW